MTDELPDVPAFAILEPPAGGLARLRAALDAPQRRRWWLVLVPVPAIAALVIWLLMTRPQVIAQALVEDPTVGDGFYWIASSRVRTQTTRKYIDAPIPIDQVPSLTPGR